MITQQNFEELLRLLEKHNAEYLIVGGYAVAFHGFPRFTKDLDIFILNTESNIEKVRNALEEFGFSKDDMPIALFSEQGNIVQFGLSPLRVDILNEIDGMDFTEAKETAIRGKYGAVEVNFIGKASLIKNKRATKRSQDAVDADNLENHNDNL